MRTAAARPWGIWALLLVLLLMGLAHADEGRAGSPLVLALQRKPIEAAGSGNSTMHATLLHRLRGARAPADDAGDKAAAAATVALEGLFGISMFSYFAKLDFPGNQSVEVLVDTGSSELLIATKECEQCQEANVADRNNPVIRPLLDLRKAGARMIMCDDDLCTGQCSLDMLRNARVENMSYCGVHGGTCLTPKNGGTAICMFINVYADDRSGYYGTLATGPVALGGLSVSDMAYGAIIGGDDHVVTSARGGGIMGMAPNSCDPREYWTCFPSFMDRVAKTGNLPNIFALCGNLENPVLVVGGVDERLHLGPVAYTPILDRPNHFVVGIDRATLGDKVLLLSDGMTATIDTGTPLCHLPTTVFEAFKAELQQPKYCNATRGICPEAEEPRTIFTPMTAIALSFEFVLKTLPTLVLQARDGVPLVLPATNYVFPTEAINRTHAFFGLALRTTNDGTFRLGETMLMNQYVEFDQESRRLGFAPAVEDCRKAAGLPE